jgi:hypothetical protein
VHSGDLYKEMRFNLTVSSAGVSKWMRTHRCTHGDKENELLEQFLVKSAILQ